MIARLGPTAIRLPLAEDAAAYIAAAQRSRRLHHPWIVNLPATTEKYAAAPARWNGAGAFTAFVVRAEDGALAGVVSLSQIFLGGFRSCYTGYYAFAGLEGAGHMTRGYALVLRHAFARLGLHRVEANIQPGNERSITLVRRLGFRMEGFSPRYLKIAGRWRDHERWAITKEEFRMPTSRVRRVAEAKH
jgi:ribosomal-protein-alanine N-acetyltransferase